MTTEKEDLQKTTRSANSGSVGDPRVVEPSRPPYLTDLDTLKNEVRMDTFRASGPGGQHRNVTDSGVRLVHPLSGVVVTATESRSQIRNKEKAFERLIKRLEDLNRVQKRRVPTRKKRAVRARELQSKHRQQSKKKMRSKPKLEDE